MTIETPEALVDKILDAVTCVVTGDVFLGHIKRTITSRQLFTPEVYTNTAAVIAAYTERVRKEAWQLGYDLGWANCVEQKGWDNVEANL